MHWVFLASDILTDAEVVTVNKNSDYCRRKGIPTVFPQFTAFLSFYAFHVQPCYFLNLLLYPSTPFIVQIHCVQKAPRPSRLHGPFCSNSNMYRIYYSSQPPIDVRIGKPFNKSRAQKAWMQNFCTALLQLFPPNQPGARLQVQKLATWQVHSFPCSSTILVEQQD